MIYDISYIIYHISYIIYDILLKSFKLLKDICIIYIHLSFFKMSALYIPYIDLKLIKFKDIISYGSGYGIIWSGTIINTNTPCAIKMIVLKSGCYYDKDNNTYIGTNNNGINSEEIFKTNEIVPFLHSHFNKKRAMTRTEFRLEISNQLKLSDLGLAPKIHFYGKSHHISGIQYGFIIMDLLSLNLREFLTIRHLTDNEKKMLKTLFDKLHNVYKIVHGDLKPANIGIKLNDKKEIKEFYFIDCNKIKFYDQLTNEEFVHRVKKDIEYFKKTSK
jgi:hypothetical protein